MSQGIVVDHSGSPPLQDAEIALLRLEGNKRLSALLIGIDKYTSISQLSGAVADVNNMRKFLTDTLHVPTSRITTLLDGEATRDAILAHLVDLQSDPNIYRDEPILIFYAGHGARAKAPKGWDTNDDQIEMIVPVHFSSKKNSNRDEQGIFDFLLAKHLVDLAAAKGNNITVILDCCHSGSASRDAVVREVTLPNDYEISASVLAEAMAGDGRSAKDATGYELHGGASHILLSACKQTEKAGDTAEGGRFTLALLDFLRKPNACNVAYCRILDHLPDLEGGQHPQCEGENVSRTLFNGKASVRADICYAVRVTSSSEPNGQRILLGGGDIHGIAPGAEFAVYATQDIDLTGPPVCRLVAQSIYACTTDMVLHASSVQRTITQPAWAVQTKAGVRTDAEFTVAVPQSLLEDLKDELDNDTSVDKRALSFVEYDPLGEPVKADLKVELDDDRVRFFMYDKESEGVDAQTGHSGDAALSSPRESSHGKTANRGICRELKSRHPKKPIYPVLQSAARFSFYLHQSSADEPLKSRLTFRAFELEPEPKGGYGVGKPSIRSRSNDLVKDGKVNVTVPDGPPYSAYGFELDSSSTRSLFAWIFMFDLAALKIAIFHRPSISKSNAQPCLLPEGTLTIGYGASGVAPREFFLPEGLSEDVSYLKVYLTSHETDLSSIEQRSPFAELREDRPSAKVLPSGTIWDTVKIAIIQKAAPAQAME